MAFLNIYTSNYALKTFAVSALDIQVCIKARTVAYYYLLKGYWYCNRLLNLFFFSWKFPFFPDGSNFLRSTGMKIFLTVVACCKSRPYNWAIAGEDDKKLIGWACNGCRRRISMILPDQRWGRGSSIVHVDKIETAFRIESEKYQFQVGIRRYAPTAVHVVGVGTISVWIYHSTCTGPNSQNVCTWTWGCGE